MRVGGTKEKEEKKNEEEKIPHMCESIGHRPFWSRCPKGRIYPEDKNTTCITKLAFDVLQYNGSKNDLDWRIDYKYLNSI